MQRAQRLEHAGLGRYRHGRAGQFFEAARQRADQGPVANEQHGALDLDPIEKGVDVARDPFEEPAEQPAVILALVGVVGELALGEHGAAGRDDKAVGAGLGQPDGLVEVPPQPVAETLDRLARACRATLVGLERDDSAGVASQD